ncbi:tRNA pseudouridine(55) synthase TruB [Clostridium tarantellae]|uniref:tRNA pseudouridine synthase B n=1 Tax=Clostridium tarantellae TaxID=39493 RepID=A0A6I1MJ38_9CLOT|nr:tRNA pseudouridine(55) synthase TruB [Clostridium tarantellae]MPQ42418.1 tRNA pseudouridine(55) synthase TruB [Clostridium tarantellae]
MNGVINVCKNLGMTSFDVVAKVRKVAKEKKVGHTGTLDPQAWGVLPVCLGKATKIIDYIMENKKTYRVSFKLGVTTDTYDLEGKILSEVDASHIKKEQVLECISKFIGAIEQVPPMYSALKKNGVRLYELARQGIEVEREARKILIYSIENINIDLPNISMDVTCSKGTYIRSLCYDIGKTLNVGATMTALCRIANGNFIIDNSVKIDELTEHNIKEYLISIEDALSTFDKVVINSNFTKLLINGVKVFDKRLYIEPIEKNILFRVYDNKGRFLGLGRREEEGFKIEKLLLEE